MDQNDFDDTANKIFGAYKDKREVEIEAKSREDEERQTFLSSFRDRVQNYVKPIFEHTEQLAITSKAADLKIETQADYTSASLAAHIGNPPKHFRLSIKADYEKKRASIEDGGMSNPRYLLVDEISDSTVREAVAEFLKRVMSRR